MKVLVSAATRHGSAGEVAAEIARVLAAEGLDVDVAAPETVTDVTRYDAVVIGSAVYYGRWLPTALDLIRRSQPALPALPVWLFSVGPIGARPPASGEMAFVDELVGRTKARGHRTFPGRLDRARLGRIERLIVTVMKAPSGDFRDWPAVRGWAHAIAADLTQAWSRDRGRMAAGSEAQRPA
jgi:menaquinone-dependent protoporphyrinogen oxidase